MVMGGLVVVRDRETDIEHPLAFHSRSFPDQYKLKHINILETLALCMVIRKFKGYIQGMTPILRTDSQYVKRVMEMTRKKLEMIPSNNLRWVCSMKEETSFTNDSTIELIKSEKNPADLLTHFTNQGTCGRDDAPYSNA